MTLASRTKEKVEAAAAELGATAVAAERRERGRMRARSSPRTSSSTAASTSSSTRPGSASPAARASNRSSTSTACSASTCAACARHASTRCRTCATSRGWIVNLASIAGTEPVPELPVYAATKAARDLADTVAQRRQRRRRRAGGRDLPRLRRHADGASWSGLPSERDDPARGLRRGRADVPAPLAAARVPQVVIERLGASTASATRLTRYSSPGVRMIFQSM